MITVHIIEWCTYGKQIAPVLMMILTAITTISILLCKTMKNTADRRKELTNNEPTVRLSVHGQDLSISTEPLFSSSIGNKHSNLNIETTQIPTDQNQRGNDSGRTVKDDKTPLHSEPTENDTEIDAIKEKPEIGVEKESSKENKKNFNVKTTRQSIMRNRLNARIQENGVAAGTRMNFVDFPVDPSQFSSLTQDSTADSWLKRETDKTEHKTTREISPNKSLRLKKGTMKLEKNRSKVGMNTIPTYSSRSATGDDEVKKSSDETGNFEETKSEK